HPALNAGRCGPCSYDCRCTEPGPAKPVDADRPDADETVRPIGRKPEQQWTGDRRSLTQPDPIQPLGRDDDTTEQRERAEDACRRACLEKPVVRGRLRLVSRSAGWVTGSVVGICRGEAVGAPPEEWSVARRLERGLVDEDADADLGPLRDRGPEPPAERGDEEHHRGD